MGQPTWAAAGENAGTAFALDGKLRLLAREDDFSATYLDLQRWEIAISEPVATSVSMVQNDGLRWRTSVGETLRNGRVLPAGTPIDSSNVGSDYPHIADVQVADTVGWFEGRMLLRHRMPLTGAFDIQIALSDFDVHGASIGLGVTRDRFQTADGASRFPSDFGGIVDANGCDIVVEKDADFLVGIPLVQHGANQTEMALLFGRQQNTQSADEVQRILLGCLPSGQVVQNQKTLGMQQAQRENGFLAVPEVVQGGDSRVQHDSLGDNPGILGQVRDLAARLGSLGQFIADRLRNPDGAKKSRQQREQLELMEVVKGRGVTDDGRQTQLLSRNRPDRC